MKDVKSPSGSLRAERATITRRRIEQTARSLFAARGYGATTLREIADEAGVAVQTVYAVYASKANILRALSRALADDPGADAAYGEALAAPDTPAALTLFAHSIRLRWETGHDIVAIANDAASIDPAIRVETTRLLDRRRAGIGNLVGSMAARDPALTDQPRVLAVIDALTLPAVYADLVHDHGWTPDEFEAWLGRTLRRSVGEL